MINAIYVDDAHRKHFITLRNEVELKFLRDRFYEVYVL